MRRSRLIAVALMLALAGALGGLAQCVDAAQGNSQDTVPAGHSWGLKAFRSSHYTGGEYIHMEIVDNTTLGVRGRMVFDEKDFGLRIVGTRWNSELLAGSPERRFDPSDGSYSGVFILVDNPIDDLYEIQVHAKNKYDFWVFGILGILLECRAGNVFFLPPPVYEDNCVAYAEDSRVDPGAYLKVKVDDPKERTEVKSLAKAIVAGASSDYERLLRIHDWVAENIYYNWDGYCSGDYGDTSIPGILKTKIAVCSGYANLTEALLRSVGIPARKVSGCALTDLGARWDSIELTEKSMNHSWNEAYIDGRWVIFDVTWDSSNGYERGEFQKGKVSYDYFDMTLEYLSLTHRI